MDQEVKLTTDIAIDQLKGTLNFRERYDNFIGGDWVPPADGQYFENTTPITGKKLGEVAR